jgi:hypothetical protein
VVGVALDDEPSHVEPFTGGIGFPVLIDPRHLASELLAISNVPTVLWIDEDDRIVRSNAAEFGTDTFAEFSGIQAGPHLDAVRAWVTTGVVPDDGRPGTTADLDGDEIRARLHFRIAHHLRHHADPEGSAVHLAAAVAAAPLDFTIARAAMPLDGGDPFGAGFFDLYERWQAAGSPYHGVRRRRA